jgi:hypothetical protein
MNITKGDLIFSSALILAIWFALTGILWVYWLALIFAYPAGLLSLGLWYQGRKTDRKLNRYRLIPIILVSGLLASMGMLTYLLLFD